MSKSKNKKEHDFGDLLVPSTHVDCVIAVAVALRIAEKFPEKT